MEKILVVSDSHTMLSNFDKIMEKLNKHITKVIHLGDVVSDTDKYKRLYPKLSFYNVSGNCDFGEDAPIENILNVYDTKIFYTHGHYFDVKTSHDSIFYAAKERRVNIALYGHSHTPELFKEESIFFMNPGSTSLPRGTRYPSYGIIDIYENNKFELSIVSMSKLGYRVIYSLKQ